MVQGEMALELWHNRDEQASRARLSDAALERFIGENRRFILRCASRTCKRFITESDEEYEVALVAFCEAVRTYQPEAGGFSGFAALVIRRRLMDFFDQRTRRGAEIAIGSAMTWEEDAPVAGGVLAEVQQKLVRESFDGRRSVRDEIEAVEEVLSGYGFGFFDLADASPKAGKTRDQCARAAAWMLADPARVVKLRKTRGLPVKELSEACGISRKLLDRHRRYIIAAVEIMDGDYPQLAEYLHHVKRAMRDESGSSGNQR